MTLAGCRRSLDADFQTLCLIDANGDGVMDVPALRQGRVIAVDGRRPAQIWTSTRTFSGDAHLLCGDPQTLFMVEPTFQLTAIDARTGATRWSRRLPDVALRVIAGDGCFVAEAPYASRVELSAATGAPVACRATLPPWPPDDLAYLRQPAKRVTRNDVDYVLTPRAQGTPLLNASALRHDTVLWSRDFQLTPSGQADPGPYEAHALPMSVASDIVVFAAAALGDARTVRLVALDAATGRTRYMQTLEPYRSERLHALEASGSSVYTIWDQRLIVFDLATGRLAWTAGDHI